MDKKKLYACPVVDGEWFELHLETEGGGTEYIGLCYDPENVEVYADIFEYELVWWRYPIDWRSAEPLLAA